MRVEYYWVPESRRIDMPKKPKRVQTVLPIKTPKYSNDPFDPSKRPSFPHDKDPTNLEPSHNRDVFYEDCGHDWRWRNGVFKYFSRIVEHSVWIRAEFEGPENTNAT